MPHPVVCIGKLIALLERSLRRLLPPTRPGERTGGVLLVLLILAITGAAGFGLLRLFGRIHPALGCCLQVF